MNDPSNRTFVCSVLFLDIVEYSRRSVAEQMRQKQKFNALLEQALESVAVSDRIVLDTGDGAAISFLGNPEDALNVGMSLRNAIAEDCASDPACLSVRTGVNLGPVRLIKDLNGQLNIIGDAINVAQRVMSFSEPGQILVSRSYYEVVYRLDPQFEKLFKYKGARTDKHVREHEVYAVGTNGAPSPARAAAGTGSPSPPQAALRSPVGLPLRPKIRLGMALPATMALIIAAGIAIRVQHPGPAIVEPAVSQVASSPRVQKPRLAERKFGLRTEAVVERPQDATQPSARGEASEKRQTARRSAERDTAAALQGANAAAQLFIVPWGEVFVDGLRRGVSPPLRVLELSPGSHKIEIRNGTFPAHDEQVGVQAGEKLTIRHRFN
jgi:class 3 adenylate cyclase